jgi:hypothetical protein
MRVVSRVGGIYLPYELLTDANNNIPVTRDHNTLIYLGPVAAYSSPPCSLP